jgi:hypothetical protein
MWVFIVGVVFLSLGVLSWLYIMVTLFRRIIKQLKERRND